MKKRLASLLMALVMVVGVLPTAAFAAEPSDGGDGVINYVSIGDSMANGYCFEGYEQDSDNRNVYDIMTGKGMYGKGAYPEQFEAYLEEQGYAVNHTRLATSAMLPEDLLYLLGVGEKVENGWDGYADYVGTYTDEELKPHFQDAITDADVITMGIGNASFGAYMLYLVTDAIGIMGDAANDSPVDLELAIAQLDPEEQEFILGLYEDLMDEMATYVSTEMWDQYNLGEVCDIAIYTAASFLLSYKGVLERIVELNNDVDIILVGLLNTTYGMEITGEGFDPIPVGDIMDGLFSALNAYIAGLPVLMQTAGETADAWKNVDVYYAEQPDPLFICQVFPDLMDAEWGNIQDGRLSGETVRKRNIRAYNGMLRGMIGAAFSNDDWQMELAPIDLEDVEAFEAAVEDGTLEWDLKVYGMGYTPGVITTLPGGYPRPANNDDINLSVAIYLGIEAAVAASTDTMVIPLDGLMNIADAEKMMGVFGGFEVDVTDLGDAPTPAAVAEKLGNYLTYATMTPDADAEPDELMQGMCKVYALFKVGDGMSVHPTPEGHDEIAKSVIAAYKGDHTASDETVENLMEAVKFLLANYETVYRYAYQYAEGQGYIKQANELLDEIKANIAAIDVASLGLSAELTAEVEALMAEILGDVQALRDLVNSPEHADAVSNFYDLVDELVKDLGALEAVAGQAGEELYEAAVQLQAKLEEALEEALKNADEEIRAAYEKVVEEITALAEQYGPEAEAFIREWLYENPKELLETILAYGKDIDAMLNHWNYHLQMILGPAWNAYGEELMAALEEVLALLGEEAAELSAQAAKELMAYIESLDLDTQIEEIADALMNGSAAIGGETLAELEEIAADLEKDLETNVKAVIDALETVAYGADSQAAKAEIGKVIELVKATEAELKGEIAFIEQDIAALAALLEESYNGATDEIPDIAREIRKLLDDPMAVLELDGEDLAHVRAVLETLCETLKEIQTSAEAISKLTTDITNAAKTINTAILTMNGELKTAVDGIETTLTEAGADAETLLAETYEAIEAFVTTTADTVYTDASALMAVCELKLTAAVNELVAAIENVVSKAVSGSVKGDCTSVYTAIGDEVEGLAEALGLTAGELSEKTALVTVNFEGEELSAFVNAQIAGMIADTVEMNEDLVNILNGGYGATILAEIEKLGIDLSAETATLDWGKYLDEKAIGVKNETLAGIAQVLMDHEALVETYTIDVGEIISPIISEQIGLEITVNCVAQIPVAELAIAAVDNLLYAYVESAAAFAAELEAVRAVAPEAEVVVLGLTDAAEELQVKIGNMTLDLAEYEEVLNAFVSAHYFAYALVNGENTTFVADAEAIAEALSVDVAGHVWNAYEKKDDETHYLVCSVCGAKGETEAHTLVDNKCVCGYEKVVEEEDRPSGGSSRPKHCPWCKTNTCHSAAFTDLDLDAWYHEYTDYVLCKGLMNGMGGTIFAPNATATRAMIITTLYRMEGSPAVTGEITFSDVAADTWYSDAVVWATQNGIVNGFADGTFAPMQNVTREQIAAIFFRLAELKGVKTDKAAELSPVYDDAGDVGAWAVKYMQWAVGEGLMKGRSTHMLVPAGETTRAETAALLQRWCEEIAD